MATKMATFVKDVSSKFKGEAHVYAMNPPLRDYEYGDEPVQEYSFVVSSAVMLPMDFGVETYLFGCDADGNIHSWSELPGSIKGTRDPQAAIRAAGYVIKDASNG